MAAVDPHLAVHHATDEVRVPVTDRRIRMPGDPAAHLGRDPVPSEIRRCAAAVVSHQGLDHGVRQLPAAQRQIVPTGRVRGQADEYLLGSGRVAREPAESRMAEGCHAVK